MPFPLPKGEGKGEGKGRERISARDLAFTAKLLISILAVFAASESFAASAPSTQDLEFFEKRIRPILAERCYECHSQEKKIKGGLVLDYRDGLLHGGESGVVIVPGAPEKSKLIEAVRYQNRDLQMPPKNPLTAAQVHDLEAWVKMGAPDPRDAKPSVATGKRVINIAEGRKFWAFKPVSNPTTPAVKNTSWVKSPVDAFVLAELEKTGLQPAPPADKRTLIRRATFDLIGLPPTPDEVESFLADTSSEAFSTVVERLLASPKYGERWGRHWLDVARYADSNGMDENVAYGNSWRYRDYVVRAFNDDKPYNRFLTEQIAGDLLPARDQASREEQLTATGFLALGARVLAEPDVRKLEMDIIDEQIDTTGKAFLGMTLGCCRCHDHKFDPVPTADYYSLAAIFRSTRSLSEEKMGAVKFWYDYSLATPAQLEARKKYDATVKEQKDKLAKFSSEVRAKLKSELQSMAADYLAAAANLPEDSDFAQVERVARAHQLRARYLLTCRQFLARNREHPVFARWQELAAAGKPDAIREHYQRLFADAAAGLKEAKAQDPKALKPADATLAAALDALNDVAGFLAIPDKNGDALDGEILARVEQMKDELMVLEDQTPDPPAIMGVKDGTITNQLPIHIRGSYLTLGNMVERGFPEVMRVSLSRTEFPANQSGRLELAQWMAAPENPLTARVMVNRVWRWHFGRGIVASTDNFGVLGDRPSHPALLDWLARQFVQEGWSVKAMHRLLMNSSTYQMASGQPPAKRGPSAADPLRLDPENSLLWHANIQRLEAEEIHDAMLAVSGSLNEEIGGKTIPLRNREYVFNHTSRDATKYELPRRALYIPIIRNHLYDLLEQFDYPDPTMPTGSRNSTVIAPQALIMMNSPFTSDAAQKLAAKLRESESSEAARLQRAYAILYARPPSEREASRSLVFLGSQPDRQEAWSLLCQTLLAANEFIYLR
jgi:hypothetical protein